MVEYLSHTLDPVFHALGDPTRRQMLRQLSAGARTVSELAAPYDMSLAAASKHIKVLEGAGLLSRDVQGRTHMCRLNAGPLANAHDWLTFYEKFWISRLDALEALLKAEDAVKAQDKSKSKSGEKK
jgi:DNA-binding transcriptional ArsR family regulator